MPPVLRRMASLAVILIVAYSLKPLFWEPLDARLYDFFQARWRVKPWTDVIVVGIDGPTRRELFDAPVYPLSRHTGEHAELLRALDSAGARAIVLDLTFSEDDFSSPPGDLIDAIRESKRVRLIGYIEEQRNTARQGSESRLARVRQPMREIAAASVGVFLSEARLDRDGTLRRIYPDPRFARLGVPSIPEHLSGVTLRRPIPIVFPTVDRPMPQVAYLDIVRRKPEALDAVRDRIVFVGQVDDFLGDFVTVPVPQTVSGGGIARGLPGVSALASMTETLLQGAPLRDANPWIVLLWNVAWCVLLVLVVPRRRPWWATVFLFAAGATAILVTGLVHSFGGLVFPCGLLFGCLFLTSAHSLVSTHVETTKILHVEQIENERVRKELEMARQTQLALLPREIPKIQGMDVWGVNVSSLEISGDYFDVIDSGSSNELVLVIADVCGKGLPAAIIMSNVHAALHSHMGRDFLDLPAIAGDLNGLLYRHTASDKFVTLFLATVDKASHRLRYVSAGHEPPVYLSGRGVNDSFELGGVPLGLLPDSSYREGQVHLAHGDLLCFFTDGVTEAMTADGDMFERERLEALVRRKKDLDAKGLAESVLEEVEAFTGQKHQADDVTLIVLKVAS